jgi:hypothetical protein
MGNGPMARLFWHGLDALDYRVTQARLRMVDVFYGPEPETVPYGRQELDLEQSQRASLSREARKLSVGFHHSDAIRDRNAPRSDNRQDR